MQMVGGNGGNQFRQYDGQNIRNQNRCNAVQTVRNQNGNVVAARAEGNVIGNNVEQHPATAEETRALYDSLYNNLATKVETVNLVNHNLKETNAELTTELARYKNQETYNDMQQKIERLQALLGDLKGKSKDTPSKSDTLDPLSQKLQNENVSEQKDTTKGTSVNTQFCKQSILGKQPSPSGSKLYSVTPFLKSKGLPKIDESHDLSKPVTSNSVPTPQESKVVKNDNVIAPGMFKINPFETSREEKFVPKPLKQALGQNRSLFHNLMSSLRNMSILTQMVCLLQE
ncbi:hypothetical protein Tco_0468198 [Tanacetum coccineum]